MGVEKEYRLPEMFKGWDIFVAQTPVLPAEHPLFFTSPWTASCNIIMLDHVSTILILYHNYYVYYHIGIVLLYPHYPMKDPLDPS